MRRHGLSINDELGWFTLQNKLQKEGKSYRQHWLNWWRGMWMRKCKVIPESKKYVDEKRRVRFLVRLMRKCSITVVYYGNMFGATRKRNGESADVRSPSRVSAGKWPCSERWWQSASINALTLIIFSVLEATKLEAFDWQCSCIMHHTWSRTEWNTWRPI